MESSCAGAWHPMQNIILQASHFLLLIAFLAPPSTSPCRLWTHCFLVLGYGGEVVWIYYYFCSIDAFGWNICFASLNLINAAYLAYHLRPVHLTREQSEVYEALFKSIKVSKKTFKELCSISRICSLTVGQNYASEGKTPCNRLSLLIIGKVKVFCAGQFLHYITDNQFLDSPEWESTRQREREIATTTEDNDNSSHATTVEAVEEDDSDVFQVTLTATTYCRYITWPRKNLLEFLKSNQRLSVVLSNLIGQDVTKKLYTLTEKSRAPMSNIAPDIRLPSLGHNSLNVEYHQNSLPKSIRVPSKIASSAHQNESWKKC